MHPDTLFYRYINDFLRSQFYCKHQIDVLTSGNVQLADILYNETAFFYFMEVCILLAIVIFMRKVLVTDNFHSFHFSSWNLRISENYWIFGCRP